MRLRGGAVTSQEEGELALAPPWDDTTRRQMVCKSGREPAPELSMLASDYPDYRTVREKFPLLKSPGR